MEVGRLIKTKIKQSMYLFKALGLSLIITLLFLFVISLLLRFTGLSELKLPFLNNMTSVVSIAIGSLYISLNVKENGWINGALVGFIYYVLIIVLNKIFIKTLTFDIILLAKLIGASLIGAISGVIGINLS